MAYLVVVGVVVLVAVVVIGGAGLRLIGRLRACSGAVSTARTNMRDQAGLLRARSAALRVALATRRNRSHGPEAPGI